MRAEKLTNRRPYISDQSAQLVNKIKTKGVSHFSNEGEVIETALKLLWEYEKNLAIDLLIEKEKHFYEKHPEEREFLSKIQGVEE